MFEKQWVSQFGEDDSAVFTTAQALSGVHAMLHSTYLNIGFAEVSHE